MLKIRELSDVIDMASSIKYDEHVWYNKTTNEVHIEHDDAMDLMEENSEFREIAPNLIEIDVEPFGRDLFFDFFGTFENLNVREIFFDRFHGRDRYRKVKNLLPRYHLLERFYKFRDEYHLKIAKKWCERNKVSFIDENGKEVLL